jgi:hypothetical protein
MKPIGPLMREHRLIEKMSRGVHVEDMVVVKSEESEIITDFVCKLEI